MKKIIFGLLVSILSCTSIHAQDFTFEGINYTITNTTSNRVEVGDNSSFSGVANIPNTVAYNSTDYTVDAIGDSAFENCWALTSVTIGNLVRVIGNGAFKSCSGLTSVTIPNLVDAIGDSAFENCWALTSVTIPDSVTIIGDSAFRNCASLTSLTSLNPIPPDVLDADTFDDATYGGILYVPFGSESDYNTASVWGNFTSIQPVPFTFNSINYTVTGTTSATSKSVEVGDNSSFSGAANIPNTFRYQSIDFTVTAISDEAFTGCSGLTSVTIPDSVTTIGERTFASCASLTSVTIPDSVTSIGSQAFESCTSLTSVIMPNLLTSINYAAFANCTSLTSVTIPDSVTSIRLWAFKNCSGLTSVTIPNSVTSIHDSAFEYCTSLTSVTIPDSVTSIRLWAFKNCTSLTSVTIGNSVTSIGSQVFANCTSLTSLASLNPTPPTVVSSDAFDAATYAGTLYVVAGSESDYNTASVWENFTGDVSIINTFTNVSSDNQWDNLDNWSSGEVPTSIIYTEIPSGQNVTINASTAADVRNLTIDTLGSLTIADGGSLIVSGTSSGNITYRRTIGTTNWYLVSSPFIGETIEDLITNHTFVTGTDSNIGLSTYNSMNDTWSYLTLASTGAINTADGYAIKLASIGDLSFTGTMKTDDTSATLTAGNLFNLLGNPYPSYINSGAILTNSTNALSSQTLWVWDQANNRYDTKVTADAFKIAPGQAFFVKSNENSGNILIDQDDQSHETSDTFQKTTPRTEVHLTLSNASNAREAKIYYLENATTGFDNGYDGPMFGGAANKFAIYTHAVENGMDENLATQSLPNTNFENMIIPLGVNAASDIEITFTATATALPEGIKVYLEDRFTNTFTRLDKANASYKIFLNDPLNGVGRFYMHTKSSNVLSTDNVSLEPIRIYKTDNYNLRILGLAQGKSNFKLFNMLGKQVLEIDFTSNGLQDISVPKLAAGVYIIQLKSKDLLLTKKIQID